MSDTKGCINLLEQETTSATVAATRVIIWLNLQESTGILQDPAVFSEAKYAS